MTRLVTSVADNMYMRENKTPKEKKMIIKEKTIRISDTKKRWISMCRNEDGTYCIGYIHKDGTFATYRKGQKNYIERVWSNYK